MKKEENDELGTFIAIVITLCCLLAYLMYYSVSPERKFAIQQEKDRIAAIKASETTKEVTVTIPEQYSKNNIFVPASVQKHIIVNNLDCWEASQTVSYNLSKKYSYVNTLTYKQQQRLTSFDLLIDFTVTCKYIK